MKRQTRKITYYHLAKWLGKTPRAIYGMDKDKRDKAMRKYIDAIENGEAKSPIE